MQKNSPKNWGGAPELPLVVAAGWVSPSPCLPPKLIKFRHQGITAATGWLPAARSEIKIPGKTGLPAGNSTHWPRHSCSRARCTCTASPRSACGSGSPGCPTALVLSSDLSFSSILNWGTTSTVGPRRWPATTAFWASHQAHPDGAGELLQTRTQR